jgi:hypothetical protein
MGKSCQLLGGVVADFQIAVLGNAGERAPAGARHIADRRGGVGLPREPAEHGLHPVCRQQGLRSDMSRGEPPLGGLLRISRSMA